MTEDDEPAAVEPDDSGLWLVVHVEGSRDIREHDAASIGQERWLDGVLLLAVEAGELPDARSVWLDREEVVLTGVDDQVTKRAPIGGVRNGTLWSQVAR